MNLPLEFTTILALTPLWPPPWSRLRGSKRFQRSDCIAARV